MTEHSIRVAGEEVDYTATAGWLVMEEDDEPIARFGDTAYHRDGDFAPPDHRPRRGAPLAQPRTHRLRLV